MTSLISSLSVNAVVATLVLFSLKIEAANNAYTLTTYFSPWTNPLGLVYYDAASVLLACVGNAIRYTDGSANVVLAGSDSSGSFLVNGDSASSKKLNVPVAITVSTSLFVIAEKGARRVSALTGPLNALVYREVAGTGTQGVSAIVDNTKATSAALDYPSSVSILPDASAVYFTDYGLGGNMTQDSRIAIF